MLVAVGDTLSSTWRTAEATRSSHSPVVRPLEWTSSYSERLRTSNHSHISCSRMVERRELELAPYLVSAFLNGWPRKEAYMKALGLGLTTPLREITVSP
jgi:hypothetical protein